MSKNNESQEQIEEKVAFLQNPWKVFVVEAFLFSLTLFLGIATAFKIKSVLEIEKITLPPVSFWNFIISFAVATLFILFIVHWAKFKEGKKIFFKILFVLAVFLGGLFCLEAWLPEPASFLIILFLIFWWWQKPIVFNQNILIILGMAGLGSVLGLSISPFLVMLLLGIFSIYDFIAVYKTKHMIKMAKAMIESRAILGLVIPPDIFGFGEGLEKIHPGGKFLILGGGDVVFPLLFCVSLIPFGILNSLIVAFFSLVGLFVSFYFFIQQKARQPIPALPPIALFSIIGYLLTLIIR